MSNVKYHPGSLNEKAQKYFVEISDEDTDKTHKCLVTNCGKQLKAKKAHNLVSHIEHCHNEIYTEYFSQQEKNSKYYALKQLIFIQNCTEIVTYNARSFNQLSDSGFQKIVAAEMKELSDNGFGINLNDKNHPEIKKYIKSVAADIRELIMQEARDKYISIMADTATKNGKSFFGISMQFRTDSKTLIRSIGMQLLNKSNTGIYLKKKVEQCLAKYEISKSHLFSVTTDNGSNMLKMVKEIAKNGTDNLNNIVGDSDYEDDYDSDAVFDNDDDNSGIQLINNRSSTADNRILIEVSDEEATNIIDEYEAINEFDELSAIINDPIDDSQESVLQEMVNEFNNPDYDIISIRCAAHTLQLAIKDALNKTNIQNLLNFCREIVKTMRQKTYMYAMHKLNFYLRPRIDCPTRWSSTYLMVSCFKLKNVSYVFF